MAPRASQVLVLATVTAAVSVVTVLERVGVVPLRDLAASPRTVAGGREWLLLTSAFVADRPAIPSLAGFLVVGLAVQALADARVLWTAAAAGHLFATLVVYAALDAAGATVNLLDYGTSAVIAAWIGVAAYHVAHRSYTAAVALCLVATIVGWLCRPDLDILDTEHAAALLLGVAAAARVPRLPRRAAASARTRLSPARGAREQARRARPELL